MTDRSETSPAPVGRNQKQLLDIAIDALIMGSETVYDTIRRIEDLSLAQFEVHPIEDTPYEPIAIAFNTQGIPTEMTLGSVTKSLYPDLDVIMRKEKAHNLICTCRVDAMTISTAIVASRLIVEQRAL